MIREAFPLLKFEIIGVFVNIWNADYKYLFPDCENFSFPIQMQLSLERKNFYLFFLPFIVSTLNFKHLQKKDDSHS